MAERTSTPAEGIRGIGSGPPGPLSRVIKDQRVLFLLVGAGNTAFSTGLFIVLALLFPSTPSPVLLAVSWLVSLVSVFFVYRKLVFRVKGHVWLDLGRFALVNLTALLVNMLLLWLVADLWGAPRIPAQILITFLSVTINYFGHKHFSFHRRHPVSATAPAETSTGKEFL
ncbi:MAG: hypothetical protein JWO93_747 [Micrococcaceae bacterium]|nr:hypothetical protein [Micrococcaceae bacterium]